MERTFNVDRRFQIFCDKLTSNNVSKDLIIESSYNTIELSSNTIIFDGHVDLSMVTCNNINISNISEIVTKFLRVKTISLPSNVIISYNSVNDGYITNTRVGYNLEGIGRSDAYFTYINVSGGDSSFNNSLYINKNLVVGGTLTISNNLLINGANFASIETSFNNYKAALEQNFYSTKITTKDVSALNISLSNELVVNKTAYINDITISGQLLNSVLKVPHIFTIDPSGYNNASGALIINGDLTVMGAETTLSSSYVDICDVAIKLASKLENRLDLSNTNAGLDISNIASLKYNGTTWDFSGGQLTVDNKKLLFSHDVSLAKRNFDLSINALITDFSSSFFTIKRNIDDSYNDTYNRTQIDNSFILRSNVDVSLISLLSYITNSYVSKNQFASSFQDIITLMDVSYILKSSLGNLNSFDISFALLDTKVDVSFALKSAFEASHNSLKTRFDISFATINANNINTSGITIEAINTRHFSQRFGNSLWNQIGQNISFTTPSVLFGISNNGRVVGLAVPADSSNKGRLYVYEISFNGTSYSWETLGLSSEIMVGQTTADSFGTIGNSGLAFSSDGKIVALGAVNNDASGTDSGQVRVFELSANIWRPRGQPINGKPLASYGLGYNVALSGNGNILVAVSRYYYGEILAYELSANSWIKMGQDICGEIYTDQPGWGALGGGTLGSACALSLDGTTIVAGQGAMNNGSIYYSGRVKIFRYDSTTRLWNNIGTINGIYNRQYFGWHVNISSNGNTIVVGSRYSNGVTSASILQECGSIISYKYGGSSWSQVGQTIFGTAINETIGGVWVSISNDGTIISFSTNLSVKVFKLYTNSWTQIGQSIARIWDYPGGQLLACVLSGDGTTFIHRQYFSNTNNRCSVYGMDKLLVFIPSSTTLNTTISGDLMVGGKTYLNSLKISNRYIFDVSGYSSNYLATTDISASIVDYYSNVDYTYNRVFRIDACGNITNYSGFYGPIVSDSRLKENIVNCTPKLEKLLKVRVVNYNLKGPDKTKYIGVVAQELEELFPELVLEDNSVDKFKSVSYSNLTILLIKAFQEQQVLINNLITTLKELEK